MFQVVKRRQTLLPLLSLFSACALDGSDRSLPPPTAPGGVLAYVSQGLDFRDDIFMLSADGRVDSNLTRSAGFDSWPTWSPDGKRIAFESERAKTGNLDLFILTLDGSAATRRITFDTIAPDAQPAWSPLGTRIAFTSNRDSALLDIYLIDTAGTNLKRLTTDPGNSVQPSWSPDGSRIAFASDRAGNGDIFVMDTLGGSIVNLTNDPSQDLTPSWSPDGQKVVFMSDRGGMGFAIWIMNADGSGQTRISASSPPCELPHWQPAAQRVAFDCDGDVFVMNPDGTNRVQITHTGNTQRSEVMPRWKP